MNIKRNKTVLVTGACGFIGSHLTEALVRQGYHVKAFVQYNSFNSRGWLDHCDSEIRGHFEVFSGDIRDPNGVRVAVNGAEVVFHLAALIAIPYSYHSPDSYVDTNIKGTLNVLQAVRSESVDLLVHTSTSEVYGTAKYVPIDEQHPLHGQSPYSATKIAADQLVQSFFLSFDTPVVTIRPFNTYGPRQSARAVIPSIITQIATGQRKLNLGALYPTRDFSFVDDTVSGFLAAIDFPYCVGETVNLGSNFEVSIGKTLKMIARIMGEEVEVLVDEIRLRPSTSEVERLWASNEKAKQLLHWKPKYGGEDGFVKGLSKTITWFQNPTNLQVYKTGIYNV